MHNVIPGSPGRHDAVFCSGYEAGRRRTIGVVAALQSPPRATTPMVRRWDVGTRKRHSGPEGRWWGQGPEQRQVSVAESSDRDSVRNQRQSAAISAGCALLDRMFMVTSGSFRKGRVVDGISGVKGW